MVATVPLPDYEKKSVGFANIEPLVIGNIKRKRLGLQGPARAPLTASHPCVASAVSTPLA